MTAADWPDPQAFTVSCRHIIWPDLIGNTTGLIYVVHGALVLRGLRDWWLRTRTPALEGATA